LYYKPYKKVSISNDMVYNLLFRNASYPLYNEIVAGQGSCLIKATDLHFASEWNSEWLRAKYTCGGEKREFFKKIRTQVTFTLHS
jgi:hypothetical protein